MDHGQTKSTTISKYIAVVSSIKKENEVNQHDKTIEKNCREVSSSSASPSINNTFIHAFKLQETTKNDSPNTSFRRLKQESENEDSESPTNTSLSLRKHPRHHTLVSRKDSLLLQSPTIATDQPQPPETYLSKTINVLQTSAHQYKLDEKFASVLKTAQDYGLDNTAKSIAETATSVSTGVWDYLRGDTKKVAVPKKSGTLFDYFGVSVSASPPKVEPLRHPKRGSVKGRHSRMSVSTSSADVDDLDSLRLQLDKEKGRNEVVLGLDDDIVVDLETADIDTSTLATKNEQSEKNVADGMNGSGWNLNIFAKK